MRKTLSILLSVFMICAGFTHNMSEVQAFFSEEAHVHALNTAGELEPAEKEALLNAAVLSPMVTNYAPLDTLVKKIFSEITTPEMSTYDKVRAVYAYMMKDTVYTRENETTDTLYKTIWKTVRYKSSKDRSRVCEAYGMLTEKKGLCLHFSAAFMVLTRAIGLESYLVTCGNSNSKATGTHVAAVIRLNGKYYLFDPVMGVVWNRTSEVETSEYFCTPLKSTAEREYCNLEEMLLDFGRFETTDEISSSETEFVPGRTKGNVHYIFGSYPQTLMKDKTLIAELNKLLNKEEMISYGYYSGNGTIGSQKTNDTMKYADVEYKDNTYRAVIFTKYRPIYTYYKSDELVSYQNESGYVPNTVYWFRYEPLEWRLTDNNTLLVCDTIIDCQPFNTEIYEVPGGKEVDGVRIWAFQDSAFTKPVNDWTTSSIRQWLNSNFLNTAFTEPEQLKIAETTNRNIGYLQRYNYPETKDKIYLLSVNEIKAPLYFLSEDLSARLAKSSDYAKIQGVSVDRKEERLDACWMLRSAGGHSGDASFITTGGLIEGHMSTAGTMLGIRPALRVRSIDLISPENLSVPEHVTARASGSNQITIQSAGSRGADGYLFYMYDKSGKELIQSYSSYDPELVINGLPAGKTYSFRVSAFRMHNGIMEKTEKSEDTAVMCRYFVDAPAVVNADASSTGTITVAYSPSEGAVLYRIYSSQDSGTMTMCGESRTTTCEIVGLEAGETYSFKVSAVSADGYESRLSSAEAVQECRSIPAIPDNVKAEASSTGTITVSWDKVKGAASYQVYRYVTETELEFVGSTDASYLMTAGLKPGTTYRFRVAAKTADGKHVSVMSETAEAKCLSLPGMPQNVTAEASSTGTITLRWDPVSDAARYKIYRSVSADDPVLIGTAEQNEFTVSGLTAGMEYAFRVAAETADGLHVSAMTSPVSAVCESIPGIPQNVRTEAAAADAITVRWDPVKGASHYSVFRYTDGMEAELAGSTAETSFTAAGLTTGETYSFRVRAEAGQDISVLSDPAEAMCQDPDLHLITTQPQNVTVKAGEPYSFTVRAAGEDLTYVWYYKSADQTSFTRSTVTNRTYANTARETGDGMQMYVIVMDKEGNKERSNTVTLTVTK